MTAPNPYEKSLKDAAATEAKVRADMAKMAGAPTAQAKSALADPKRLADAQYVRTIRHYTMRPEETIDDVKAPGFFKNLATKFDLGDILEVRAADLTFWSQLMVVSSDHIGAHVELRTLTETKLPAAERREFDADGYCIEDTGDVLRRLAVVRTADGKLMRDGFKTRQDATRFISTELVPRRLSA